MIKILLIWRKGRTKKEHWIKKWPKIETSDHVAEASIVIRTFSFLKIQNFGNIVSIDSHSSILTEKLYSYGDPAPKPKNTISFYGMFSNKGQLKIKDEISKHRMRKKKIVSWNKISLFINHSRSEASSLA